MAFLEAGRNKFCSGINRKSWVWAGGKLFRCLPGRKRSQRSPAHGYHRVQFHGRRSNESPLSSCHRLLRPLVLTAKCSFGHLGVIRESLGGRTWAFCGTCNVPLSSIYQLPMWCVNILILNDLPQVKDLSSFKRFFLADKVNILVTIWEKEYVTCGHRLGNKKVCPKLKLNAHGIFRNIGMWVFIAESIILNMWTGC